MMVGASEETQLPSGVDEAANVETAEVEMQQFGDRTTDGNADDETEPPPLSSLVGKCRFWWQFLKIPLVALVVNVIIFASFLVSSSLDAEMLLLEGDFRFRPYSPSKSPEGSVALCALFTAIVFVADSVLLFYAAKEVKKQLQALEQEAPVSSLYSLTNVHGRVSKMADNFLTGTRAQLPKVSLFVNLTYLGMCLCATAGMVALVIAVYLYRQTNLVECLAGRESSSAGSSGETIPGVPSELQAWAQRDHFHFNYRHARGKTVAYLQNNAGTFFAATKSDDNFINDDDFNNRRFMDNILMHATGDGDLTEYSTLRFPNQFATIDGEGSKDSPAVSFCFMYWNATDVSSKGSLNYGDTFSPGIGCFNSKNKVMHHVSVLNGKDPRKELGKRFSFAGVRGIKVFGGKLWWIPVWWNHGNFRGMRWRIRVYSMDVTTFDNVQMVAEKDLRDGHEDDYDRSNPCLKSMYFWIYLVDYLSLFISSWLLLRILKVPAGTTPAAIACYVTVELLDEEFALYLGLLGVCVLTVCLVVNSLPKLISRDGALWALYTALLCCIILALNTNEEHLLTTFVVCVGVGITLNHPVLQLLGWAAAVVTAILAFILFLVEQHAEDELGFIIVVGILGSAGLGSLGYSLSRYRGYLVWYGRRTWRMWEQASRRHRSDHRSETESLL